MMPQALPAYVSPFDLNDVRNAARQILGAPNLPLAVEAELQSGVARTHKLLRAWARSVHLGNAGERRRALFRLRYSLAVRLVAFILANGKGSSKRLGWSQIRHLAGGVDIMRPSGEIVRAKEVAKKSGGSRWICAFGAQTRAAQKLANLLILVVVGHSQYEHARKGRGRETAIRETLNAVTRKGVKWFGVLDVKDFFGSITPGMVSETLGFLPKSLIDASIYVHNETDIHTHSLSYQSHTQKSVNAIRGALPQGSMTSNLVASKVLEKHLIQPAARFTAVQVDNIILGGKTAEEVQLKINALASSLEGHPQGSLFLTQEVRKLGDPAMDYLGYRIRGEFLSKKEFARAGFSEKSRFRFVHRMASKLLFADDNTWNTYVDSEAERWVRSFPNWRFREQNVQIAALGLELDLYPLLHQAIRILKKQKRRWSSFEELRRDSIEIATEAASLTPRLHTSGPSGHLPRRDDGVSAARRVQLLLKLTQPNAKKIPVAPSNLNACELTEKAKFIKRQSLGTISKTLQAILADKSMRFFSGPGIKEIVLEH